MIQADTQLPGADLQPIEDAPAASEPPERETPSVPEEGDPTINETEVQPS